MFLDLFLHIQEQVMEYCSFEDLKNLSLTNSKHRTALQEYLHHAINVPKSNFENMTKINAEQLEQNIEKFKTTKVMRMHTCLYRIPKTTFEAISTLTNLHKLNMSRCRRADDSGISIICNGLKQLKVLILSYSKITVKGCLHVSTLSRLERLVLRRCNGIGDDAMTALSVMTSLRTLDVGYCVKITQDGFHHSHKLSKLENLTVRGCKLKDTGFSYVADIRQLRKLDASYSEMNDAGVAHLKKSKFLEELNIRSCTLLTNACVAHLKGIVALKVLHIHECNITEDQDDELKHLTYLNRWKFVPAQLRLSGILQ